MQVLLCRIADVRYALALADVDEVVRAAAVTPLPGAPPVILGLLDLRGAPVPVLDARRRFGHPERPLDPAERFVVARAGARRVALRVDAADGVAELDPALVEDPRRHVPLARHVAGVAALPDGLVLVHDVATFLAAAEAEALTEALAAAGLPADGVPDAGVPHAGVPDDDRPNAAAPADGDRTVRA